MLCCKQVKLSVFLLSYNLRDCLLLAVEETLPSVFLLPLFLLLLLFLFLFCIPRFVVYCAILALWCIVISMMSSPFFFFSRPLVHSRNLRSRHTFAEFTLNFHFNKETKRYACFLLFVFFFVHHACCNCSISNLFFRNDLCRILLFCIGGGQLLLCFLAARFRLHEERSLSLLLSLASSDAVVLFFFFLLSSITSESRKAAGIPVLAAMHQPAEVARRQQPSPVVAFFILRF